MSKHPEWYLSTVETYSAPGTLIKEPKGSFGLKAPSVTIHIDATETFTTAFVLGERYLGVGTAKRNPRDKHKPQVGVDIALARAYRELADKLEADAL